MPMISVIIPVYNVEKYLPETLDCLLRQSFEDAEFIMVNDGSKDSSPDICRSYADRDPRFKLINQPNGGPAKARNTGLDAATGEYICFMDADDLLADEALQKMYDMVQGYDILVHGTDFIGDYDEVPAWIANASKIRPAEYDKFSIGDIFSVCGCGPVLWLHFIRAEIIQKERLRIDEKLFIGEDFAFAVRYFANAQKVKFVTDKFYSYRLFRTGSLMTTYEKKPREKLEQAFLVSKTIYYSIVDKIRPSDEPAMIQAILIFNFRDFYRLDHEIIADYAKILCGYMDFLHINFHLQEISGITIMMYGYIRGVVDGTINVSETLAHHVTHEYWDMFLR